MTASRLSAFIGTWELIESYSENDQGRSALPLGDNVTGRINYDAGGNMAAQLMGPERSLFSSRNPAEVTDAEYRSAFQTYTSYCGTYDVDFDKGTVTHHVVGASAPSWPGHDQVRYFELGNDRITLRTPPMRGNDGNKSVHTLVWQRMV